VREFHVRLDGSFLARQIASMQSAHSSKLAPKESTTRAHKVRWLPRDAHARPRSATVARPAAPHITLDAADLDALLALARAHDAAEARRQATRLRTLVGNGSSLEPAIDAIVARADDFEHARRLATTDALTGVGNRRAFVEQLRRELSRARRTRAPLAVLLLDLDDFKAINDGFSHATGDHVLRLAARAAKQVTRQEDFVARFGGDEFAVLLPGADGELARSIGERIRARFASMSDAKLSLRLSFGAALLDAGCGSAQALLAAADRELYRDKAARKSLAALVASA
jgi:diguanylate cyclase (GGDEF)-like protein